MAAPGVFAVERGVPSENWLSRQSALSVKAGLASLTLVAVAIATMGASFNLLLGHALALGAVVFGVAGIYMAHRAGHSLRRDPRLTGAGWASLGLVLSLAGVLGAGLLNGLLLLAFHPLGWLVALVVVPVALSLHSAEKYRESRSLETMDLAALTLACSRCGCRGHLDAGEWWSGGWFCGSCQGLPWEVGS